MKVLRARMPLAGRAEGGILAPAALKNSLDVSGKEARRSDGRPYLAISEVKSGPECHDGDSDHVSPSSSNSSSPPPERASSRGWGQPSQGRWACPAPLARPAGVSARQPRGPRQPEDRLCAAVSSSHAFPHVPGPRGRRSLSATPAFSMPQGPVVPYRLQVPSPSPPSPECRLPGTRGPLAQGDPVLPQTKVCPSSRPGERQGGPPCVDHLRYLPSHPGAGPPGPWRGRQSHFLKASSLDPPQWHVGTDGQSRPRGPASLSPPLLAGHPPRAAKPRPLRRLRGEHVLRQEGTAQEERFPETVQSKHSRKGESQALSAKSREAAWQDPQSTVLIRKSWDLETFSG